MTSPTMVERAARAYFENRLRRVPWDYLSASRKRDIVADMAAAIATMRVPTEAMRKAWQEAAFASKDGYLVGNTPPTYRMHATPEAYWQAAIDAALAPAPEGTGTGEMG